MIKKTLFYVSGLATLTIPMLVSAQLTAYNSKPTLATVIDYIITYANRVLVLLMGIAVVMFIWYVIQYYIKPNAERKEGNTYVMYSLIGFFIALSFWGLVNILQNTFGLNNANSRPGGWSQFLDIFPENAGNTTTGNNRVSGQINGN